jgi:hypothetical protein
MLTFTIRLQEHINGVLYTAQKAFTDQYINSLNSEELKEVFSRTEEQLYCQISKKAEEQK